MNTPGLFWLRTVLSPLHDKLRFYLWYTSYPILKLNLERQIFTRNAKFNLLVRSDGIKAFWAAWITVRLYQYSCKNTVLEMPFLKS